MRHVILFWLLGAQLALAYVPRSGNTPAPTNVTVNGSPAQTYGDLTFARTNITLTNGNNTFTTVATNNYGVSATNVLTVNLPSTVTFQNDLNGNTTSDGTRYFVYNAENQLTNVYITNLSQTELVYDGLGRRRIEKDFAWQSGAWVQTNEIHFIYDGMLLIQERASNNAVMVTYTRGLDLSGSRQGAGGIGGLLARTDTNGSTFYHADGAGNITALINGNQNIVARYEYNPFGKLLGMWGSLAPMNKIRFSSKWYVTQADLYDFGWHHIEQVTTGMSAAAWEVAMAFRTRSGLVPLLHWRL